MGSKYISSGVRWSTQEHTKLYELHNEKFTNDQIAQQLEAAGFPKRTPKAVMLRIHWKPEYTQTKKDKEAKKTKEEPEQRRVKMPRGKNTYKRTPWTGQQQRRCVELRAQGYEYDIIKAMLLKEHGAQRTGKAIQSMVTKLKHGKAYEADAPSGRKRKPVPQELNGTRAIASATPVDAFVEATEMLNQFASLSGEDRKRVRGIMKVLSGAKA